MIKVLREESCVNRTGNQDFGVNYKKIEPLKPRNITKDISKQIYKP